jgi:hypothetical protein
MRGASIYGNQCQACEHKSASFTAAGVSDCEQHAASCSGGAKRPTQSAADFFAKKPKGSSAAAAQPSITSTLFNRSISVALMTRAPIVAPPPHPPPPPEPVYVPYDTPEKYNSIILKETTFYYCPGISWAVDGLMEETYPIWQHAGFSYPFLPDYEQGAVRSISCEKLSEDRQCCPQCLLLREKGHPHCTRLSDVLSRAKKDHSLSASANDHTNLQYWNMNHVKVKIAKGAQLASDFWLGATN